MRKIRKIVKSEPGTIAIGAGLFAIALVLDLCSLPIVALAFYLIALAASGYKVFLSAVKGILRGDLLDEKFLMSIASVGAMIIGEYKEGVAVLLFFLVGEYFEHRAVKKSRNTIKSLMSIRPDEAVRIVDNGTETVFAEDLVPGDIIVVKSGERVAADSEIVSGGAYADTSMLTGESVPFAVSEGDTLMSGSIIVGGAVNAKVLRPADESGAQRILDLVENATERKSREENFITAFSHYYTPIVVIAALIMAILPSLIGITEWRDSIYRALTFLVISCPCALVISVPMAFFGGIGAAASAGILFKGGNRFSAVAKAQTVAFDKTGTLTTGELAIARAEAFGISESELLKLAASCEYVSGHPIARCIKSAVKEPYAASDYEEIAGLGSLALVNGEKIAVGNRRLMSRLGISASAVPEREGEVLVARGSELIGVILISDTVKSEAASAIASLKKLGVKNTVILSGDKRESVEAVAKKIGITECHAELMPEEKFARLEERISTGERVMFVGDGINDAPSLTLADVGIAMGAIGTDQAIEAADVVIMSDNLERLPTAVRISAKTVRIAKENIVFALGVKICVLILSMLGFANMWLAVFADVGVAVLAILNAMRALSVKE